MQNEPKSQMSRLFEACIEHITRLGGVHHLRDFARLPAATAAELDGLAELAGSPLPPALSDWWRAADRAVPLMGAMTAYSARQALAGAKQSAKMVADGVFDPHLANITSWSDGRWDDGVMRRAYWCTGWVPVAQDGCGNQLCVDLAPGPRGRRGQVLQMEWQDGQGPYQSGWPSLLALLRGHLHLMKRNRVTVDDEGIIEFEWSSPGQIRGLLKQIDDDDGQR